MRRHALTDYKELLYPLTNLREVDLEIKEFRVNAETLACEKYSPSTFFFDDLKIAADQPFELCSSARGAIEPCAEDGSGQLAGLHDPKIFLMIYLPKLDWDEHDGLNVGSSSRWMVGVLSLSRTVREVTVEVKVCPFGIKSERLATACLQQLLNPAEDLRNVDLDVKLENHWYWVKSNPNLIEIQGELSSYLAMLKAGVKHGSHTAHPK
ncbi:hypothetical protein EG327_011708 [Venturia inaequalis]|uniref:Uncharacterized protein n=1 Tax=Venturia inaequalis TaxID=5025 RepID=A0A8H3Z9Q6_VENIN|nr:hypothetical protein EG327_011708 [Venturia inaequalis]